MTCEIRKWKHGVWILALGSAFALGPVGCGGGGGDDGGSDNNANNGGNNGNNNPPAGLAPATVNGRSYRLQGADGITDVLRFPNGTQFIIPASGGRSEQNGTYNYVKDGNTATITTSASTGLTTTFTFLFATTNTGNYSFSANQAGQATQTGNGTFTEIANDGGNNNGGGNHGGNTNGPAPATLTGRTMLGTRTFTSTGPTGQTHTYTFTASNFHDSDPPEESDGMYTYIPNGTTASLTLNYTGPQDFAGDRHEVNMVFQNPTSGTFTSTYTKVDNDLTPETIITINGTFEFLP